MKLKELKNKKILIVGLAKEGTDALKFLKKTFPKQLIHGADKKVVKKMPGVKYYSGEDYLKEINRYDVIVKSPGIPLSSVLTRKKITSASDIFLNNCQGLVIGVTGTKGKSTTSSLIHKILEKAGFKASLIGNIGKTVLNHLTTNDPSRIYVYELSSFQLSTVTKSPEISIFLNLYKDHLDYHQNFQEYLDAKKRIFKFQKKNDFLLYNKDDSLVRKTAKEACSIKMPFSLKNNELYQLIGFLFQIPEELIASEIKNFKPLEHRLEFIGKYKGISFYDDSSATIPEATINAINILGDSVYTLIVGGVNKGFNLNKLVSKIKESKIKKVICFPETGNEIARKLPDKKTFLVSDMKKAVSLAYQETKKNKICLLSPGASSFNLFKNAKERGLLFKKYVKNEKRY
jgi:UDP-N-acetylmuramoyl-L-alanine---L-glutamate ligase